MLIVKYSFSASKMLVHFDKKMCSSTPIGWSAGIVRWSDLGSIKVVKFMFHEATGYSFNDSQMRSWQSYIMASKQIVNRQTAYTNTNKKIAYSTISKGSSTQINMSNNIIRFQSS